MLQIFTTGGTIDKVYFDAKSDFQVGDPQIVEILKQVGATVDYQAETLLRKDSLEITDDDRARIVQRVLDCEATQVIITHGTDTMAQTGRAIEAALRFQPDAAKTVVLVGSLTPARFRHTDAEFNIGFAVGAVQSLAPGVYVAMNGKIFSAGAVRKNRAANRFEVEAG
ncbi:MAG: asparaginase domain-containing protein [Bacteroidota bacterium]